MYNNYSTCRFGLVSVFGFSSGLECRKQSWILVQSCRRTCGLIAVTSLLLYRTCIKKNFSILLLFKQLPCIVPYSEEVLVPSEHGGLGVGVYLGVHVGLPHPGGEGLCVGEGEGGGILML